MNKLKNSVVRILSSHGSILYVAMVLIYCFLYEWVNIFSLTDVKMYVNILKFVLPFVMFLGLPSHLLVNFSLPKKYLLYFLLFMVWGLVPNILSGHVYETMLQWSKFILRFFFCYVIFVYLLHKPEAKTVIMKALVVIALGVVLQYVILSVCYVPFDSRGFALSITTYFGPYGFLGDGNASLFFINRRIFRLTGFWFEPSNASAFLFATFFLTKVLFDQTQQMRWKLSGFACLGGGLFTFSNAGQFALGCALLFGVIVQSREKGKNYRGNISKVIILLVFIFLVLFGRVLVVKFAPNSINLRNLAGLRDIGIEPFGGRIEQLQYNYKELILKNPLGIGFRIMGIDTEGRGVAYAGAAPLAWLVCTGWVGLFLILMREGQVLIRLMRKDPLSSNLISTLQAWLVLFCQNIIFGTWMTPLYFLLVAMVFTTIYYPNDNGVMA